MVEVDGHSQVITNRAGSLPPPSQNSVYLDGHADKDPRVAALVLYPHSLEFPDVGRIRESALPGSTFCTVCRAVVFLSFTLCTDQGEEIGSGSTSSVMCSRTGRVCDVVVY